MSSIVTARTTVHLFGNDGVGSCSDPGKDTVWGQWGQ
ncbi:hypothetical protein A2U01_0048199, partial [Trifolium medium]|nr:hypothetical protein [Trifolium medium]